MFANLLWHMIGNQLQCAVAWIHLEVTRDPIVTTQVRHACSCCGISSGAAKILWKTCCHSNQSQLHTWSRWACQTRPYSNALFSTTLLQNTFCFHDCFLPRFSWLGAKFTGSGQKTQSHAKSSKPKSMTDQTTTTTNVANYNMQKVWRIQCYPGLVDYSILVRRMFTTNEYNVILK